MCGYFGNLHECPAVIDLMNELGMPLPYPIHRANPSFGVKPKLTPGLITYNGEQYETIDAVWWYARKDDSPFFEKSQFPAFNARDLTRKTWRAAIRLRRGVVFATEIGEKNKDKQQFLMRSEEGFALGCLYQDTENADGSTTRSFAVITRDPHERFSKYHEKAFPLFLPLDAKVIEEWLDPTIETSLVVEELLNKPKLTTDLEVTQVKTYLRGEALGESEVLEHD